MVFVIRIIIHEENTKEIMTMKELGISDIKY